MCYAAIPYIAMAIGTAATVAGQNQQRNEAKRAQAAQDQFNAMQKKMVLDKQAEENQFSQRKQQSVLNEAEVVAPDRVQQVQQAADTQTASNVNALQQANLLGEESVAQGAQGNQSNAYLKARAEAAAKQTDQAIKLARLFGATGAGNTAVANQAQSALDYRLDQQAIDANRRSMQRGYDWMFDDLSVFQLTAARRRLVAGRGMGGCCLPVSTHSRPKAAGRIKNDDDLRKYVSTHSRPKAAGWR